LDPRGVGVSHAHADRRKIGKEPVDASLEKPLDFGIEITMGRWRRADLQIVGKKLILGTESPNVDPEIHRVRGAYALGARQMLGNADPASVGCNLLEVA
jgi:hypothetical protein